MKVLHLYSGNLFGGVETLLVTLAQQQQLCSQMLHHFALCFQGKLANQLQAAEASVYMLGHVRTSRPWTVLLARRQLDQLLKQQRFDVVICHACWPQAIFGPVVKSYQLPLVFWCHDTPKGKHWLERWAKLTLPDLVIANSDYTKSAVPQLYPGIDTNVLYLPVPAPDIGDRADIRRTVRSQLNTSEDAVVIIQASRLERWKGQSLLLSALAQLSDLPHWVCWIAGGVQRPDEVQYWQQLQGQVQELGIAERVKFLGQRDDVSHLLVAADIHSQPNTSPEPFGIAFVEALYAGLPVVTTAMGGTVEIVNQSCGRLVAPNNVNALSQVLQVLITDSQERVTLAANGRSRALALCDPARQLTQLHKLLSYLVSQEAVA